MINIITSSGKAVEQVQQTPVPAAVKAEAVEAIKPVAEDEAAVYEQTEQYPEVKTYNKETVAKLKSQAEVRYENLKNLVERLLSMQNAKVGAVAGITFDQIQEAYDGNLKDFFESLDVDAATAAQAQQDISEDGYWGVKQASQRLVDFAIALSGDDPAKAEELKAAIRKGYEGAEKKWGGELPGICKETIDAALAGIDDWVASKK